MELPKEIYLTFAGEIDNQVVGRFLNSLDIAVTNRVERVNLLLQSTSGFVDAGIALHNFLTNLPLTLITYNGGAVQSIALLPFLAGKVRNCSPDASFLVHKTTFAFQGAATAEMMRARADAAEDSDKKTDAILKRHINMPDEKWALRDRFDLTISAEDAKKFGLVHNIAHFAPQTGSQIFNI